MGHYDKQREEREDLEEREMAARQGITVEQYRANVLHEKKMRDGKAIYEEEVRRNELMVYYLQHQPSDAALAWPSHPGGTKK